MSGVLALMAVVAFACGLAPSAAQPFQTSVPHAILIDAGTSTVLFEKRADDPVPPGSTAKALSAEMVFQALKEGRLRLDDELTVSEYAWRTGGAPSGGSAMFLAVHSRVRAEDLIRGMIVDSGNDATITLAEAIAGSEEGFVIRMNKRAAELSLTKSRFGNPWGKDSPDQRVTARDMAKLAAHIIKTYPDYYRYFGEREFLWNKIRQQSRNPLLGMSIGADGLYTGNIGDNYGLIGSAFEEGRRLIVVVYGAKSARERAEEARKLLQWGFRSFEARPLFKAGEVIGIAQLYGGAKGAVDLAAKEDVVVLLPRGATEKLSGRIVYEGPVPAPVEAGTPVGRIEVKRGNTVVLEQALETAESVEPGSLPRRAFDAAYEYLAAAIHTKIAQKTGK